MHAFNELDLWNRRHTELVREAQGVGLKRSLRQARRARMESSTHSGCSDALAILDQSAQDGVRAGVRHHPLRRLESRAVSQAHAGRDRDTFSRPKPSKTGGAGAGSATLSALSPP